QDLHAALEDLLLVREPQLRPAAAEQPREHLAEARIHAIEGVAEACTRGPIQAGDRLFQVFGGALEITALRFKEGVPFLELRDLRQGSDVDVTHDAHTLAQSRELRLLLAHVAVQVRGDLRELALIPLSDRLLEVAEVHPALGNLKIERRQVAPNAI